MQETARQEREQYEKFFGNTKVEKRKYKSVRLETCEFWQRAANRRNASPSASLTPHTHHHYSSAYSSDRHIWHIRHISRHFFFAILVPHTYHHYNTIFIVSAYKSKHHIEKHGMIINILNIHIIITSTSLFLTDTVIMIINHCQMTNIMYDDMYDIDMDMYLIWILRGPSLRDHWHKLFPLNDWCPLHSHYDSLWFHFDTIKSKCCNKIEVMRQESGPGQ